MRTRIEWLGEKSRKTAIVERGRYTAVVRFTDESEEAWKRESWSLDLRSLSLEADGSLIASANFLSSGAPMARLIPGVAFELYEGPHCSARGVFLGSDDPRLLLDE